MESIQDRNFLYNPLTGACPEEEAAATPKVLQKGDELGGGDIDEDSAPDLVS